MNSALRHFAFTLSVALTVPVLGACSGNDAPVTKDILAQDSTLNLEVMTAGQDTALRPLDDSSIASVAVPVSGDTQIVASTAIATPERSAPNTPTMETVRPTAKPSTTLASTSARPARSTRALKSTASRTRTRARAIAQPARTRKDTPRAVAKTKTRVTTSTPIIRQPAILGGIATIPAGSDFSLVTERRICTNTTSVGDKFNTRFDEDVVGPTGIVIPKGSVATAEVTSVKNESGMKDIGMRIEAVAVGGRSYSMSSDVTYTEQKKVRGRSSNKATKIAAGAGVGAVAGQVIGGGPATAAIGAAGGALAGAVLANRTTSYEQCVPDGGHITARLNEPLKVRLGD